MDLSTRAFWIALAHVPVFGAKTLYKLFARFNGDGEAAWHVTAAELEKLRIQQKSVRFFAAWRATVDPLALAERVVQSDIRFTLHSEEDFPAILRGIWNPPFHLFLRGRLEYTSTHPFVAIVGTRGMSAYGARVARQLANGLAERGITVVSGFANGIDATAHAGALERGGITIAVLPGGSDDEHLYPQSHLVLARAILKHNGGLISEYPPDTSNLRHHFPLRNRIIAGLSAAVVIVEAAERSGSLITASLALQEHREILAVPGPITSPQSKGTHQLIKMGATPCTGVNDILEALHLPTPQTEATESLSKTKSTSHISHTPEEQCIVDCLTTPKHIDAIARELTLTPPAASSLLLRMELSGTIEHLGGQWYQRRE